MRDVRSGAPCATTHGPLWSGRLRATATVLTVAVLLVMSLGLISTASLAERAPESVVAADSRADRLWLNGPISGSQPLPLVSQDDDATPAVVGLTPAVADDGTPVPGSASPSASATPDLSGTCYLPNRDALAVTPAASDGTPVASNGTPAASAGTPVAIGGTPVAAETPAADLTRAGYPAGPASEAVARDVEHVVSAVSVCLSNSDYETLNDLVQDDFRGQLLGVGEPVSADDFGVFAEELPPSAFTVSDVTNVTITDDGDATAVVRYVVGNQLRQGLWTFSLLSASASFLGGEDANGIVRSSARWVVDSEEVQEPDVPEDAQQVDVTLDEYSIEVDPNQVDAGKIALEIANDGEQDHEVIVLRLEDGATADELLYIPGPDLPDGISIAGQLTVPSGDEGTMVLEEVESGSYALVDLFPDDESGLPNLSLGMEADLEVGD